MLAKLAKYRVGITILATLVFSMALAPAVLAETDPFGLSYGTVTQLGSRDLRATIASIINVALSMLGIVALVIILFGGFKWMTAGGNDDQVAEARKIIVAGIVGLAVILSSYAIANFVLEQLIEATEYGG